MESIASYVQHNTTFSLRYQHSIHAQYTCLYGWHTMVYVFIVYKVYSVLVN